MIDVPIRRLDDGPDLLDLPARIRPGDAAADLPARYDCTIGPGQRELVQTGFAIAVPTGACGLILPRSGLALKFGLTVLNSPGLIDSGYRGELQIILHNISAEAVEVKRGQRIAQLLILTVDALRLTETIDLPPAPDNRGTAGFGSSG